MTNPNNALGTNAALNGRTSVNAFNDNLAFYEGRGILSGFAASPGTGLQVVLGGDGTTRDVAIAEDNIGNRTTINNISQEPVAVDLAPAPDSGTRIDAVVAYVSNPPEGQSTVADNPTAVGVLDVAGLASTAPIAPDDEAIRVAITADGASGSTAYYVVLAEVTVSAGLTDVTSTLISPGEMVMNASRIDTEKQDTLVSGETLKTVNGQSLLGEGNIDVGGSTTVDTSMSASSTNPVQNRVITHYADGVTEGVTVPISAWSTLSDNDPFTVSATMTVNATIGPNSLVELYNDDPVAFATYGFAIGGVDPEGSRVTFYATEAPETETMLTINVKEVLS